MLDAGPLHHSVAVCLLIARGGPGAVPGEPGLRSGPISAVHPATMVLAEPKMSRIDTSQLDVRSLTRVVGITSDPDRKLMVIPAAALKLTAAVRGNACRLRGTVANFICRSSTCHCARICPAEVACAPARCATGNRRPRATCVQCQWPHCRRRRTRRYLLFVISSRYHFYVCTLEFN